jgi:predicted GIY-YIG superfamily endonuclease
MKYIYLIQSLENGYYKIGVSKNPQKRLLQLQTGNSSKLNLVEYYPSEYANKIEKTIHNFLSHQKKEGEWFDISLLEALSFTEKCKQIEENINILKKSNNVFI